MTDFDKKLLLAVAAAIGAYVLYKKTSSVVAHAANAVNPMNPDNVINQGATTVFQNVTGSTDSIGGSVYEYFHPIPGITRPAVPAGTVNNAPSQSDPTQSGDINFNLF